MTNQEIREIFNQAYNIFWMKWRDKPLLPEMDMWDLVLLDAGAIMERHNSELCKSMVTALVVELDNRSKEREAKNEQKPV